MKIAFSANVLQKYCFDLISSYWEHWWFSRQHICTPM